MTGRRGRIAADLLAPMLTWDGANLQLGCSWSQRPCRLSEQHLLEPHQIYDDVSYVRRCEHESSQYCDGQSFVKSSEQGRLTIS